MLVGFLLLILVGFGLLIWKYKITDEERKKIQEEIIKKKHDAEKLKENEENERNKIINNGSDNQSDTILGFLFILALSSIYFYKVWTDPEFTLGFVGYALIIIFLVGGFVVIGTFLKSEKKYHENLQELNKQKKNVEYSQSSFDDFIAGRMSLAKCFWLYHVLIGFVLGFLCAYFAEMYEQRWLYIFPFAYYAVVTVAVWNCATLYAKDKLENRQPYGWAIAAKILIVLNAIGLISQIILMLNAK